MSYLNQNYSAWPSGKNDSFKGFNIQLTRKFSQVLVTNCFLLTNKYLLLIESKDLKCTLWKCLQWRMSRAESIKRALWSFDDRGVMKIDCRQGNVQWSTSLSEYNLWTVQYQPLHFSCCWTSTDCTFLLVDLNHWP